MTKRFQYLSAITVVSLTAMLVLQVYFLIVTYKGEKEEFLKDLNTSIELVHATVKTARWDEVHRLHVRDLKDTSLIQVRWISSNPQSPMFQLIEPGTRNALLTYTYGPSDEKFMTKDEIYDNFLKMGENEGRRMYFSLSEEVDERHEAYRDTVSVDLTLFREELDKRFVPLGISTEYDFVYLDTLTSPKDLGYSLYSEPRQVHGDTDEMISVIMDQPVLNVLERMYLILTASMLVIALIAISFFALKRTINRQRRLSDIKDDFIDSMTHELLTPIATLKISLETLENQEVRADASRVEKYLKISKMELSRVSDIVHNVLYSSLHEQQQAQLKIERVDINELLEGLVNYHQNINDHGIQISCQKLEDPWVETDKQHLTNVLHNLIDNGIKYAGKSASINIIPKRFGQELSIVVNDNGSGIPEAEQGRIFDKFYRAKAVESIKGLGVGLYYAKSILARLHGSIELLHSSPKGSSFKVSLNTSTDREQ